MNAARQGFVYDCNNQNITALQLLKVTMTNPENSGKKVIVEGYSIPNMGNLAAMATMIHMPTGKLPTTEYKPLPYLVDTNISAPNNVGVFKADVALLTDKLTGGTKILSVPIQPAARNFIEGAPLTLLPGVTLAFEIAPGIIMNNITFAVYTREEVI